MHPKRIPGHDERMPLGTITLITNVVLRQHMCWQYIHWRSKLFHFSLPGCFVVDQRRQITVLGDFNCFFCTSMAQVLRGRPLFFLPSLRRSRDPSSKTACRTIDEFGIRAILPYNNNWRCNNILLNGGVSNCFSTYWLLTLLMKLGLIFKIWRRHLQ